MASVSKREVIQTIIEGLRLDPGKDRIPNEVLDNIQAVFVANPQPIGNIVRSASRTGTGTTAIFTTPTDKDFFLTSAYVGYMADVTADTVAYEFETTVNGVVIDIIILRKLSLTAADQIISNSYPVPIKIDRGVAINLRQTFTVGASTVYAGITGCVVEP